MCCLEIMRCRVTWAVPDTDEQVDILVGLDGILSAMMRHLCMLWAQAVSLALQCLSFDFVGTCLDESAEDLGTIQVQSLLPCT